MTESLSMMVTMITGRKMTNIIATMGTVTATGITDSGTAGPDRVNINIQNAIYDGSNKYTYIFRCPSYIPKRQSNGEFNDNIILEYEVHVQQRGAIYAPFNEFIGHNLHI